MDKLLSIAIPTCNMQDYLHRCLDTFIIDAERMALLEVLVINDGSKDRSSAIAHEYEQKYPDTFRVIDKENGHYGSCINRALREATGKYFKICDADDWYDSDALVTFLDALKGIDTDVVYTSFNYYYADRNEYVQTVAKDVVYGKVIDLTTHALDSSWFLMHMLTYKVSLLRAIGFRQEEGICYTDNEYVFYPLCHAKSLYCVDVTLYQYFFGREGQSMAWSSLRKNFSHFERILHNFLAYPSEGTMPSYNNLFHRFYFDMLTNMISVHCLYSLSDKSQERALRRLVHILALRDPKLLEKLDYVMLGPLHYFRWWHRNTLLDRIKLRLLSLAKRTYDAIKGVKKFAR